MWQVKPVSDTATDIRISISRKRDDGYVQDFGGYVRCIGSACANKAARLREGDRIKLGDVDVSNNYVKEKNTTYTNFKVFSFDLADSTQSSSHSAEAATDTVDDGELDDSTDPKLPF